MCIYIYVHMQGIAISVTQGVHMHVQRIAISLMQGIHARARHHHITDVRCTCMCQASLYHWCKTCICTRKALLYHWCKVRMHAQVIIISLMQGVHACARHRDITDARHVHAQVITMSLMQDVHACARHHYITDARRACMCKASLCHWCKTYMHVQGITISLMQGARAGLQTLGNQLIDHSPYITCRL